MITLFSKAATTPEELPADPALARLAFLGRHLEDLQTIRLAGIPIALMELPLLDHVPRHALSITMVVTAALSVAWYYLGRQWFRNRYGRSWNTDVGSASSASWAPSACLGFTIFALLYVWSNELIFAHAKGVPINVAGLTGVSVWLGQMVSDRTNLPVRRTVYKFSSLAVLVCMLMSLLADLTAHPIKLQREIHLVFGVILLALALFDAWLLHHTFAQTRAQAAETA